MKKTIVILALLLIGFWPAESTAQVRVSFNIGLQPIWGPVGYDYVDYYYLPDIDAYYNVPERHFVYYENGAWINSGSLPARYHDFDLFHAHKVVINEDRPWMRNEEYRNRYSSYKGHHDNEFIRDSHDSRYFENKDHPEHDKWKGNGHGEEHGNGKGPRK